MNTMQRVSSEATNIRVANKCRKAHLNQHVLTLEEVLKDWFISILNYILKFQVAIKVLMQTSCCEYLFPKYEYFA